MAVSNEENMLDNNFDEQSSIVWDTYAVYARSYTVKMANAQKFHASRSVDSFHLLLLLLGSSSPSLLLLQSICVCTLPISNECRFD